MRVRARVCETEGERACKREAACLYVCVCSPLVYNRNMVSSLSRDSAGQYGRCLGSSSLIFTSMPSDQRRHTYPEAWAQ